MSEMIQITELSAIIQQVTGGSGPGYRAIYHAAIDAVIPAEKRGRNWCVHRDDVSLIIAALGLTSA